MPVFISLWMLRFFAVVVVCVLAAQPVIDESDFLRIKKKVLTKQRILSHASRSFISPIAYTRNDMKIPETLSYDLTAITAILDEHYKNPNIANMFLGQFFSVIPRDSVKILVDAYNTVSQLRLLKLQVPILERKRADLTDQIDSLEHFLRLCEADLARHMDPHDPDYYCEDNEELSVLEEKFSDILILAQKYRPENESGKLDIPRELNEVYFQKVRGVWYLVGELDDLPMDPDNPQIYEIKGHIIDLIHSLPRSGLSREMISSILFGPLEQIVDRMNKCVVPEISPEPVDEETVLNAMERIEATERELEQTKNELVETTKSLSSVLANIRFQKERKTKYLGNSSL